MVSDIPPQATAILPDELRRWADTITLVCDDLTRDSLRHALYDLQDALRQRAAELEDDQ